MGTGAEVAAPEAASAAKGATEVAAATGESAIGATEFAANAGALTELSAVAPGAATAAAGVPGLLPAGTLETLKTAGTILSPVASLASASAGIDASKRSAAGLANGVSAPTVAAPITMPILGEASNINSLKANLQEQLVRRGRAATILTAPDDGGKLGS